MCTPMSFSRIWMRLFGSGALVLLLCAHSTQAQSMNGGSFGGRLSSRPVAGTPIAALSRPISGVPIGTRIYTMSAIRSLRRTSPHSNIGRRLENNFAVVRELRQCGLHEAALVTRVRPDHVKSRRQVHHGNGASLHERPVAMLGGHLQHKLVQRFLYGWSSHEKQTYRDAQVEPPSQQKGPFCA